MQYQESYSSSVPHVTLQPATFQLNKLFFAISIIYQAYFMLFCIAMFILNVYFRVYNHKLLLSSEPKVKKDREKENIICQVLENAQYMDKQGSQNSGEQQNPQTQNTLKQNILGNKMRLIERRLTYLMPFTIGWIVSVNFFKANIVGIIFGALFIVLIGLLNLAKTFPNWKITIILYIIPSIASFVPYISEEGSLYYWETVIDSIYQV